MKMSEDIVLQEWYRYAATKSGFIGDALCQCREQSGKTLEEQQYELGVDDRGFLRLKGMLLPRVTHFAEDIRGIVEVCGLACPERLAQLLQSAVANGG